MTQAAIALPFSIDPFGNVTKADSDQKLWGDRVRSVIGTALKERVVNPTFGTMIPFYSFINQQEGTEKVQRAVEKAFLDHLPLLSLSEVKVVAGEGDGTLNVTIIYDLPDNKTANVNLGFVRLSATDPLYEETS